MRPPNLLGPLYLRYEPAGWFIPAGRFPGLIVIAIAGIRLHGRDLDAGEQAAATLDGHQGPQAPQ